MTNLELFALKVTKLTGTIPSEIGTLTDAYVNIAVHHSCWLRLYACHSSHCEAWGAGSNQILHIAIVRLIIFFALWDFVECSRAFLFSEALELQGSIPSEIGLMKALEVFHVSNTDVQGTIPTEMGLLEHACKFTDRC